MAHLAKQDDNLVNVAPILERYGDFAAFLVDATDDEPEFMHLRQSETTGRLLGSEAWMQE
jgi:putative transposase